MIFKIFSKLYANRINQKINQEKFIAVNEYTNNLEVNRNKISLYELEIFIDKKVICISNEWENPVIGVGKEIVFISKTPFLIVHDYLTNTDLMITGKIFNYTEQRFDAIMKLDAFELCSLIYANAFFDTEYKKEKSGIRSSKEDILIKLEKTDFFNV